MAQTDIATWRRNNSDPLLVEFDLLDGTKLKATVLVPREKQLRDVMNTPEPFVEIESIEHGTVVVARTAIKSVKPVRVPKADQLAKKMPPQKDFDPHAVLGIAKEASLEAIHDAHMQLVEAYHPDRFAGIGLPAEVMEYLQTMAQRVEEAHWQLTAAGAKPQPVTG